MSLEDFTFFNLSARTMLEASSFLTYQIFITKNFILELLISVLIGNVVANQPLVKVLLQVVDETCL